MEGYVLLRGQEYESAALTDAELEWLFELVDDCGVRFPVKQCYQNAQRLVLHHADTPGRQREGMVLSYVEGYGMSLIPVQHAWLALNGKVVDVTMRLRERVLRESKVKRGRLRDRVLGQFPESRQYFGVVYAAEAVRELVVGTGCWGSVIDDWQRGWPVLRAECCGSEGGEGGVT